MQFLRVVPKNLLSRIVGRLVESEAPSPLVIKARDWFIARYKIDMSEAERPLAEYPSIAKLFIRKLKPGIRPIAATPVVHPCDGVLTTAEEIKSDTLIQAKGHTYSLAALLASPTTEGQNYIGGRHLIYYLCPTDYHRVHSPIDGEIVKVTHVPGALWPVNSWSVNTIDSLFAVNERVIVWIKTPKGLVALVLVGATNVGKITLSFDAEVQSNVVSSPKAPVTKTYSPARPVRKGDEVGIFNMGSTVVMIYPPGLLDRDPAKGPTRLGGAT